MFGFEPLADYPLAPFHPEARNGLIGRVVWREDGGIDTGFLPMWFEPPGRPVLARERSEEIADYVDAIGRSAGLPPLDLVRQGEAWRLLTRSRGR
jgi:poly-gamma-glutamate synthesis protein (capsule biosynthesis protein)